jgi:sulfhydrogenase subunit beta (sulfur reductase)
MPEASGARPDGPAPGSRWVLERADFPHLLTAVAAAGYRLVGPTVRDGAIVYGPIATESDLPIGWTDRQDAGSYRLERRPDAALFGYNVGPHSWKKYLFPSRERLFTARRQEQAFSVEPEPVDETPMAYLGVRACELAAIRIQDRVFTGGPAVDPGYAERRRRVLLIAVQCGQAGRTCFCVSMGTGPAVRDGFDLSLTERIEGGRHAFLVEVGSESGARVARALPLRPAGPDDLAAAEAAVAHAAGSMGRTLDTEGIHDLLLARLEDPEWAKVGERCLACTNCTMACPTCFCHTTEEVPSLDARTVERWRRWDSCFNASFSELHTGSVRATIPSRYRQWMTHKLATWYDQFDSSGCVGCGRCITWCPVGIDITAEAAVLRSRSGAPTPEGGGR